jgi:hypothetical protein
MYQVNEDETDEHVTRMEEVTNAYRNLVDKPERKRSLGRPRGGWKDI